mmetsp:Transcript_41991/g.115936  ORF Transcript_41991/g.115936 Transcript_41991/m.115936 type:complete len:101 (-) Transcript_41991:27-329(-)
MHGMHYEGNVLLDETVQLPLAAAEDLDPAAKADVLDEPTWKWALRSNVLKKTYEIMREKVYPLLEVREGTWKAPMRSGLARRGRRSSRCTSTCTRVTTSS